MKPLPPELQPLFSAAYEALFAIEQALSPDSSNDDRRAVFRVRAALGDVENVLRAREEFKDTKVVSFQTFAEAMEAHDRGEISGPTLDACRRFFANAWDPSPGVDVPES